VTRHWVINLVTQVFGSIGDWHPDSCSVSRREESKKQLLPSVQPNSLLTCLP